MSTAAEILRRLAAREAVEVPVAVVAAHPDDEVIGAGAAMRLLPRLLVVHVTDGAPRNLADARRYGFDNAEAYAAARRAELRAALDTAGLQPELAEFGASDQEASLRLADLAEALARLFERHGAVAVVTHPYEGGHPDHDATAFAVSAACGLLARRAGAPEVIEMTSYHAGPQGIVTGAFLDNGDAPLVLELDAAERDAKRAMLDRFATQRAVLTAFGVEREAFRPAPEYDFVQPPHAGRLHYEGFDWGMDGPRWRSLAAEAQRTLGLAGRTAR